MAKVSTVTREVITEVTEAIDIRLSVREAQALSIILGRVNMENDGIITSNIWEQLQRIPECKYLGEKIAQGTISFVKPLSDFFPRVS